MSCGPINLCNTLPVIKVHYDASDSVISLRQLENIHMLIRRIIKSMFLYNVVSNLYDCSKHFTLHSLADLFFTLHSLADLFFTFHSLADLFFTLHSLTDLFFTLHSLADLFFTLHSLADLFFTLHSLADLFFTFHSLADLFFTTPTRHFWEALSQVAIMACTCRMFVHI